MVTAAPESGQFQHTLGMRIELRGVSHEFDLRGTPLPVLDRISLTVDRGEFVALLGPSGCGKSTLLRLIAGLEPASAGQLRAEGTQIQGPDPERGLVFQDPTLFPWRTVWNNIALGLEARGLLRGHSDRVDDALKLVGLDGFESAYPHQLSGGMAQRVALARALVNRPKLLLLDEPLGKLDSLTRMTMQGELAGLWRRSGFTALLVTHDVEEAVLLASRVIVLSGRPASIKAEKGSLRRSLARNVRAENYSLARRQRWGSFQLGFWRSPRARTVRVPAWSGRRILIGSSPPVLPTKRTGARFDHSSPCGTTWRFSTPGPAVRCRVCSGGTRALQSRVGERSE